jgi:hydrogenase maturation factor HypF (carbamoyltransferase family)
MKTLVEKLENSGANKNTIAYKAVKMLLNGENSRYTQQVKGNRIRPVHTSGSGRFCKNMDYTKDVIQLLEKLELKYTIGNDAPKGGLTGNYIDVITPCEQ